jgi:membrane protein required for beta-lactamase induction
MLPKKGKNLHRGSGGNGGAHDPFERGIAAALQSELGRTHQAVKTVMIWTGASERTVKHWLAGTYGPNGQHLVDLARHSNAVLAYFLTASGRRTLTPAVDLLILRAKLADLVAVIDANT